MKLDTKKRKKATRGFEKVYGREKFIFVLFKKHRIGFVPGRDKLSQKWSFKSEPL